MKRDSTAATSDGDVSPLKSKLPRVGTTTFTVASTLASEKSSVNLGQGFPNFDCDSTLVAAISDAMQNGFNQYPPMTGMPALREASDITVTAGATQGLLTAIICTVHPGDEVIVIEPAYDSYIPAIELAGGKPVLVQMTLSGDGYAIPWERIATPVGPRTRMIMINSQHNPTGSVLNLADIEALEYIRAQHRYPDLVGRGV